MLNKKVTKDYVDELAKKHKLPKKTVQKILQYGMKNVCRMIYAGEDIQLPHFGTFYYNKEFYANYLKAVRNAKDKQNNNQSPSNTDG